MRKAEIAFTPPTRTTFASGKPCADARDALVLEDVVFVNFEPGSPGLVELMSGGLI
jgi:hypothetical protein